MLLSRKREKIVKEVAKLVLDVFIRVFSLVTEKGLPTLVEPTNKVNGHATVYSKRRINPNCLEGV